MAMSDFFRDCNKLTVITARDSMGGIKIIEERVEPTSFGGLAVNRGNSEQIIGAKRGYDTESFNFHCDANVALDKDDKIRYTDEEGNYKYLRLTSGAVLNTPRSSQSYWKTYRAETYLPVNIKE